MNITAATHDDRLCLVSAPGDIVPDVQPGPASPARLPPQTTRPKPRPADRHHAVQASAADGADENYIGLAGLSQLDQHPEAVIYLVPMVIGMLRAGWAEHPEAVTSSLRPFLELAAQVQRFGHASQDGRAESGRKAYRGPRMRAPLHRSCHRRPVRYERQRLGPGSAKRRLLPAAVVITTTTAAGSSAAPVPCSFAYCRRPASCAPSSPGGTGPRRPAPSRTRRR
jgi:hypothetical protein